MTADEIRNEWARSGLTVWGTFADEPSLRERFIVKMLCEIAAQLATANEVLKDIRDRIL